MYIFGHRNILLSNSLLGYCTEYNIYGTVIQDKYGADCTKFNPPCQKSYNSEEAYKCPFNLTKNIQEENQNN